MNAIEQAEKFLALSDRRATISGPEARMIIIELIAKAKYEAEVSERAISVAEKAIEGWHQQVTKMGDSVITFRKQ